MFGLAEYPFIRISVLFAVGILIDYYFTQDLICYLLVFSICLIACLIDKKASRRGIYLLLIVTASGCLRNYLFNDLNKEHNILNYLNKEGLLSGRISNEIQSDSNYTKCIIEDLKIKEDCTLQPLTGKALLYFKGMQLKIKPGDEVLFYSKLLSISEPLFYNNFNYRKYLKRKNVFACCYIKPKNFRIVYSSKFSIYKFSFELKQKIINVFNYYLSSDESAMAIALITGETDYVSSRLIEAFKNTGTMHLLAVSGMHVALIYLILNFILKSLRREKYGELFTNITILSTVWLFCLIAGLSDSVVRSGVMITFLLLANTLNKKINTVNLLFACIFMMLAFKPTYLFNTGLQLSLSAVFGIIFFHTPLKNLVLSNNKILNFCWDFTSISIAAQIGTLPVVLYYFNQFPVWFLISNTLLIPISTLLIYLCICIIIFSPLKIVSYYIAILLNIITKWFIAIVINLNKLPFLLINSSLSFSQALILGTIILFIYWIIYFKRYKLIKHCLALIIAILIIGVEKRYSQLRTNQTILIKNKQHPYLILKSGEQCTIIGEQKENFILHQITDHLRKENYTTVKIIPFGSKIETSDFYIKDNTFINEKGIFKLVKKDKNNKVESYISAERFLNCDTINANLITF